MKTQSEWIDFGRVAHDLCNMQSQYCSRYIDGRLDYPWFGEGLRFRKRTDQGPVDAKDYHDIQIHRDDAETFAKRVNEHRRSTGEIL
jgi:hypothetical protein